MPFSHQGQDITVLHELQFSHNVRMQAQQKERRFQNVSFVERQTSLREFFPVSLKRKMKRVNVRGAPTPLTDQRYAPRAVSLRDYDDGAPWDKKIDILRSGMLDPTSAIVAEMAASRNRQKDAVFVESILGNAQVRIDEDCNTEAKALPDSQKISVDFGTPGVNSGFTMSKLKTLQSILRKTGDESIVKNQQKLYLIHDQQMLDDLLESIIDKTTTPYTQVEALRSGTISYFMGFEWIPFEEIPADPVTGIRPAIAFGSEAMIQTTGEDWMRVDPRPDLSHLIQIYNFMQCGAVRLNDEFVSVAYCDPNA